jgi:acyl-coenzyme A synthetase/AMP-(fatty) acid ligase
MMRCAPAASGARSDRDMINWFDHILFHTRTQPETPAMVMEDRVVTYGMLGLAIERCALRIAALDFPRDGAAAVIVANPIRHMVLCLALFRLGLCSLSLTHGQQNANVPGVAFALGDREASRAYSQVHASAQRLVEVTDAWFTEDVPFRDLPTGFTDASQVCRMSLTSGTTGAPKILQLTVADMGGKGGSLLLGSSASRRLCLPGLASALGFWTATAVLTGGGTLCFSDSPYQSIRMIELFAIEHIMASTEHLLALTRVARTSKARLPSLRLIETGGAMPSRALLEAAMIYVCRDVFCRYGASEAGPMARAPARDALARPGLAGYVLPGVEIAIVDTSGKPCAPGAVGLVRSRRDPRWDGADIPWVDLGDVGWLTEKNELFIVGRAADIDLAEAGKVPEISPVHEAEHLLRLEWDATDAAAITATASDGRPQLVVATVDCKDAEAGAFEEILRARGFDFSVRIVPVPAIPRGVSGKVSRAELKVLLLSHS